MKPRSVVAWAATRASGCGSNVAVRWIRPVLELRSASFQVLQDLTLRQNDCLLVAGCGRQAMILVRHSPLLSRLPATPGSGSPKLDASCQFHTHRPREIPPSCRLALRASFPARISAELQTGDAGW